jgi:OmpA-OmpF porin, OOP family
VLFAFNKDILSSEDQGELDKLADQVSGMKRYFIAVEGFTDQVGSSEYNLALSRRRGDAVVNYMVLKHNLPVYRIQLVGLGKEKLADEGKGREARAKNRRVEVTVFSADTRQGSAQGGQAERQ